MTSGDIVMTANILCILVLSRIFQGKLLGSSGTFKSVQVSQDKKVETYWHRARDMRKTACLKKKKKKFSYIPSNFLPINPLHNGHFLTVEKKIGEEL